MNRKKWRECVGMPAYEAMVKAGLSCSDAAVIERLYGYVGAEGFELYDDGSSSVTVAGYGNRIYVHNGVVMPEQTNMSGGVTIVLSPRSNLNRYEMCRELVESHNGLSLDCWSMMLFFHYTGLSKENIKL